MLAAVVVAVLASSESFEFEGVVEADRPVSKPAIRAEPVHVQLHPVTHGPTLLEREPEQVIVRSFVSGVVSSAIGFGGTLAATEVFKALLAGSVGDGSASQVIFTLFIGLPVISVVSGLVMVGTLAAMGVAMVALSGAEEAVRKTAVMALLVAIPIIIVGLAVALVVFPPSGLFTVPAAVAALGFVAGTVVPIAAAGLTPGPAPAIPVARF